MENETKNPYVKEQLTKTLITMLSEKSFKDISISELTKKAEVSRISFYRNYDTKEDILREYTTQKLRAWQKEYDSTKNEQSNEHEMFGSMFEHFKINSTYYLTLYNQGLSYILLDTIKEIGGPKPEYSNVQAYLSAFICYGLYGWIEEWFARGMTESAETMADLLKQHHIANET